MDKETPFIIRNPKPEDLMQLWEFINTLSKEQTFISLQGRQLSLNEEKEWLEKELKGISEGKIVHLVIEVEGKIVGGSEIHMFQDAGAHIGRLGISIGKDFRNRGLGRALMSKVLEEAKRKLKDLKIIVLGVYANNPGAISLYKDFGFKEYGRLPKGFSYKGGYIDEVRMYKEI